MVAKIYEMPQNDALSEKEQKFVTTMMTCPTLEAACRRLHISRDTGQRLLSQPRVKKAYESACQQVFAVELSRLQKSAGKAITFLEETLESDDPNPTKVRAAAILLSTSIEVNKNSEFDKRLAELETRFNERQQNGATQ